MPDDGRSRYQPEGGKYPVSEFIWPLLPDNYPDEQPTSAAELSIVLEPVPGATIGGLARDLAMAILSAVSGQTSAQRRDDQDLSGPTASAG
jgi:hypothetical protein